MGGPSAVARGEYGGLCWHCHGVAEGVGKEARSLVHSTLCQPSAQKLTQHLGRKRANKR